MRSSLLPTLKAAEWRFDATNTHTHKHTQTNTHTYVVFRHAGDKIADGAHGEGDIDGRDQVAVRLWVVCIMCVCVCARAHACVSQQGPEWMVQKHQHTHTAHKPNKRVRTLSECRSP